MLYNICRQNDIRQKKYYRTHEPLTLVLPILGSDGSSTSGSKNPAFSSGGKNNPVHLI